MLLTESDNFSAQYNYLKGQLQRLTCERFEEAFAAGGTTRDRIADPDALRRRQQQIREIFLASLGGLPPMATPLNAQITGTMQEDGFRIEKVVFESRPKALVTANLYIPNGIKKPTGAVLFLCGHHLQAKHVDEYQVVCRHLVQAGLIVLAQDPIGQGERLSYYERILKNTTVVWGTAEHDHAGTQCLPLGDCSARYFLHDAMRGLDYLVSRPEVDLNRIGVTGNSGGGTQTCMMMMGDPRIAAAAPGTCLPNHAGGGGDAEQIWPGLSAQGIDVEDYLIAMCPKPVCVLAAQYDFIPIEGSRQAVERCRRFWKMMRSETNLELVEDAAPHSYTPKLAREAARFFARHLLGKECVVDSTSIQAIEPSRLWCLPSGQTRAERDDVRAVFEENQDRLAVLEAARTMLGDHSDEAYKAKALQWLKERIDSHRRPMDLNPRFHVGCNREQELVVDLGVWWSQKGIQNEGLLFRNFLFANRKLPVTLAVWDGGTTQLRSHLRWLRQTCNSGRAILVLNVTGVGGSEPHPLSVLSIHEPFGALHQLNDDLIFLDDSLCAFRIYDVLQAVKVLDLWPGVDAQDLRVYAHGTQGLYAEMAAAVEPRLSSIEVQEEMESFADWVRARHYNIFDKRTIILPGVLKYFDLPDLRRWRKKKISTLQSRKIICA